MKTQYKIVLFLLFIFIPFFRAKAISDKQNNFSSWDITTIPYYNNINLLNMTINKKDVEKTKNSLYQQYLEDISSRKNEMDTGLIKIDNTTMKFSMNIFGSPQKNGYPVYIALRGGGNTDIAIADEQYEIAKINYSYPIQSGILIVPYGVTVSYDEHYRPESFLFYDRFIQDAIAFYNADPNRVYLLGFSSGGDGVYAIAPHTADLYAAVNMSAGYPHTWELENLYNLPFCIQMGEYDSAYDRNTIAARYTLKLNEEQSKYGGGFPHQTFIHTQGTHNSWNDYTDMIQLVINEEDISKWLSGSGNIKSEYKNTNAVKWLNQYTRDPLPKNVVWNPSIYAGLRSTRAFYWLDRDGNLNDVTVIASYEPETNSVSINTIGEPDGILKVYLKPEMLDVFKDVTIKIGEKAVKVKPIVSKQIMHDTLYARGDINYMFTSEIDIQFNRQEKTITVTPVKSVTNDYDPKSYNHMFFWDSDGLFYVDQSIFGLTFNQLENKMPELKLQKPEKKLALWGKNLSRTYWNDENNRNVIFMFQNGITVLVYGEYTGKLTDSFIATAEKAFGNTNHDLRCGGTCRYYLESNPYHNTDHIKQTYTYYLYEGN